MTLEYDEFYCLQINRRKLSIFKKEMWTNKIIQIKILLESCNFNSIAILSISSLARNLNCCIGWNLMFIFVAPWLSFNSNTVLGLVESCICSCLWLTIHFRFISTINLLLSHCYLFGIFYWNFARFYVFFLHLHALDQITMRESNSPSMHIACCCCVSVCVDWVK